MNTQLKNAPRSSLNNRLGRIGEWCKLTNTSRVTTWRQAKAGKLQLTYVGNTPYVARAEAVRLGFIKD